MSSNVVKCGINFKTFGANNFKVITLDFSKEISLPDLKLRAGKLKPNKLIG